MRITLLLCLLAFGAPALAQCPGPSCPPNPNAAAPQSDSKPFPMRVASDCPGKGCPKSEKPASKSKSDKKAKKKSDKKFEKTEKTQASAGK
jgi:hypothetical protein